MPGQLDTAQQRGEGAGAVLGGDRAALVLGQVTIGDQVVEPAGGAAGGGEFGRVGEQLGRGAHRLGFGRALGGLGERGQLRVRGVERGREHRLRGAVQCLRASGRARRRRDSAGDDMGGVGVPAAGHPDVQRLDTGRGVATRWLVSTVRPWAAWTVEA